MKTTTLVCVAALAGSLLTLSAALPLQDKGAPGSEQPADGTADMAAMMGNWLKNATPGEAHADMAAMAGRWNVEVKHWMSPDMPPEASDAEATFEMIMGGRFMVEHVDDTTPMGPFEGMGITGYDNVTGEYVNIWLDNMSTGIMVQHGTTSADGTLTMTGTMSNPMADAVRPVRTVVTHGGADVQTVTMYETREEGEVKVMEITYTRVAAEAQPDGHEGHGH